ncbi:MAG: hypothetical protein JRI98_05025, partial [Deltaproteobacteria bacterium]|nr:hypothetical protein [Deltaproteobacteria bacterium]
LFGSYFQGVGWSSEQRPESQQQRASPEHGPLEREPFELRFVERGRFRPFGRRPPELWAVERKQLQPSQFRGVALERRTRRRLQ